MALEFRIVKIADDSMLPTLHDREVVIIKRLNHKYGLPLNNTGALNRDEIVLVRDRDRYIIKRIAAVAGDVVTRSLDGAILVNGKPIDNAEGKPGHESAPLVSKVYVPTGYVYLLGDNPAKSSDSRSLGVFAETHVAGRMVATIGF